MANERVQDFDFAEFIKEFGHGETCRRAGEVLCKLVQACQEARATGSMTIQFKVGALDGLAELKAKIKADMPQRGLPSASYFVVPETGALVTEDPRQLNLPTRVLDIPNVKPFGGGKAS